MYELKVIDVDKMADVRSLSGQFYRKSEVDQVIAKLKDKCQMHDFFWEGCGFAKRGFKNSIAVSEAFDKLEVELDKNNKELRHQKYKICLAMAERCKYRMYYLAAVVEQEASKIIPLKAQIQRYEKRERRMDYWKNRWLELAENFTEAK